MSGYKEGVPMSQFILFILERLQKHPKRVVFADGEDARVLDAAQRYVRLRLGPAIVLGSREEIHRISSEESIDLNHIHIIDPSQAEDMPLFIERLREISRFRDTSEMEARETLSMPGYFATMMVQNGQADGLVAGSSSYGSNILRPLFQIIKPRAGIKMISSCMVIEVEDSPYGEKGVFFFADAGIVPNPTAEQLANIAIETGKLKRQLTGVPPHIAMLSYSTKGSAQTKDSEKIALATELARQKITEEGLEMQIDGEMQADAALVPEVAQRKVSESPVAGKADVLIFPDLNSASISAKLVQHLAKAKVHGQILIGLERPAAEISRAATAEDILGVAAIVAMQAVEYRRLYSSQT